MFDRLMSELNVRGKIALLLVCFSIPLGVMTYFSLSVVSGQVQQSDIELRGVDEITPMLTATFRAGVPSEILAAQQKVFDLADSAHLTFDNELDAYSLQTILTLHIPDLSEHIARAYEGATDSAKLFENRAVIENNTLPEFWRSVQDALANDDRYYGKSAMLQEVMLELQGRHEQITTLFINATKNPKEYYPQALAELTRMTERVSGSLHQVLKVRRDAHAREYYLSLVGSGLALSFLSILSWIIVRNLSGRLQILHQATHNAAERRDLTQRVNAAGGDEIGSLSNSFNLMVSNLRTIIDKIVHSGGMISSSVVEIAAVSKQQQATTSEIAATTTQIEATSKQISATAEQLSRTMQEVQTVSTETAQLANEGQGSLEKIRATMDGVTEASLSISEKLEVLNQKASKIGTVVTAIAKVADQTNLLSLNAAIEAEKAGEYGHGFSVVAREIRRLADQTAASTIDIEQMVREIQGAVGAGVMGMEKFANEIKHGADEVVAASSQLSTIIRQIQTLTPTFEEVAHGMESQAVGARQITESLSQLSTAARQTADSITQSNTSIDQLHRASTLMEQEVQRFHLGEKNDASA